MQTNAARGRFGLMRPLPQSIAVTDVNRILLDHSVLRCGGDGFIPVVVAAALIASAILLALD
jgi:hypothetical protein